MEDPTNEVAAIRDLKSRFLQDREIKGRERDYGGIGKGQDHLLDLSYAELEERNLEVKKRRLAGVSNEEMRGEFLEYLKNESGIKAVVLFFSDLHGRFHALDYDKKYMIESEDNLTFDGSSVQGFSKLSQSDLRLKVDWRSFRWLPAEFFGVGKVMVFANVCEESGDLFDSDFRGKLSLLTDKLRSEKNMVVNVAPEIEGFLFKGENAEQYFDKSRGFKLATMSGYFSSLPQDTLRLFMDKFAEVKRALGFQNEKDHPEVGPAQFELTFKYSQALDTADQIQIYKLLARQVARSMGLTACFLPKPVANLNGNGMHVNMSVSVGDTNVFSGQSEELHVSDTARKFIVGILRRAKDLCLVMNASVNSYRRLDPNFEAPNEIKFSDIDRSAMIRIPMGNGKSSRIEVRTVAPDTNPYMCIYSLIMAGMEGMDSEDNDIKMVEGKFSGSPSETLPHDIYEAMNHFENSAFIEKIFGKENREKYVQLKSEIAERSPRSLGTTIKSSEIIYHHEVTNQLIWDRF